MLDRKKIDCDLCIVGGGLAGLSAAVSAARAGIRVVLMHERPVLGGNASSEIRMWICGAWGDNNRETGIVEEIQLENMYRNPTKSYAIFDTVLYELVRNEKNVTMLLNCTCMDATVEEGDFADGRKRRIKSVIGYQMTTQCFYEVSARFFCDASGDSILAPLTGAEFRIGREASGEFGEDTVTDTADTMTMGMSCLLGAREVDEDVPFTPPSFATKLTKENFIGRDPDLYRDTENFWYLELGGDRNTIADTEILRDELVALAAGTWDHIKNSGEYRADRFDLDFLGFLPGKRESRRMMGEYMITQRDLSDGVVFDDEVAFGGWPLDDHFPGGFYHRGTPNVAPPTNSPYSIPYRALYSRNVENLYFAGRNISMTHTAMSSVRVMATCSLIGQAVGCAAAVATKRDLTPNGVYREAIGEVQAMLQNADCFLPSRRRAISPLCTAADLSAPDSLRNGEDRPHKLYGTAKESAAYAAPLGEEITYRFPRAELSSVHVVFDSDLNRKTLDGSQCERTHTIRMIHRKDSPRLTMPKTLCRAFVLYGERDGERTELLRVTENRKRAYHLPLAESYDALVLVPLETWGDESTVNVISFDFA